MKEYSKDLLNNVGVAKGIFFVPHDVKVIGMMIDMINDFAISSAMKNPLTLGIVAPIYKLFKCLVENGNEIYAVNECHPADALEFATFPRHGEENTKGAEILDGLKDLPFTKVFHKNCTNAFMSAKVKKFIDDNPNIKVVVIVGVCVDICVMQFALALKTYCNQIGRPIEIVIQADCVETYDAPGHNRDLFYKMALELMMQSGIKVVKEIKF